MTNKELRKKFDEEDLVWKRKLDGLCLERKKVLDNIDKSLPFEERMNRIDTAINMGAQIRKLDVKHKKFLLKWIRKFRRKAMLNLLLIRLKGE